MHSSWAIPLVYPKLTNRTDVVQRIRSEEGRGAGERATGKAVARSSRSRVARSRPDPSGSRAIGAPQHDGPSHAAAAGGAARRRRLGAPRVTAPGLAPGGAGGAAGSRLSEAARHANREKELRRIRVHEGTSTRPTATGESRPLSVLPDDATMRRIRETERLRIRRCEPGRSGAATTSKEEEPSYTGASDRIHVMHAARPASMPEPSAPDFLAGDDPMREFRELLAGPPAVPHSTGLTGGKDHCVHGNATGACVWCGDAASSRPGEAVRPLPSLLGAARVSDPPPGRDERPFLIGADPRRELHASFVCPHGHHVGFCAACSAGSSSDSQDGPEDDTIGRNNDPASSLASLYRRLRDVGSTEDAVKTLELIRSTVAADTTLVNATNRQDLLRIAKEVRSARPGIWGAVVASAFGSVLLLFSM